MSLAPVDSQVSRPVVVSTHTSSYVAEICLKHASSVSDFVIKRVLWVLTGASITVFLYGTLNKTLLGTQAGCNQWVNRIISCSCGNLCSRNLLTRLVNWHQSD